MQLKINIIDLIVSDIAKFYRTNIPKRNFNIDLIFQEKMQEIRGIRKSSNITIWRYKEESWTNLLAIICHELGHAVEKKSRPKIRENIQGILKEKRKNISVEECDEIIGEAILRTLVPNGLLAIKYGLKEEYDLNKKSSNHSNNKEKLIKELKYRIIPISKQILETNKTIFDDDYIKQIALIYDEIR